MVKFSASVIFNIPGGAGGERGIKMKGQQLVFLILTPQIIISFQPVLHNWCNKGCGMYYPVCGMMHIKEPLLLIGKSSPCGGSGFLLLISEWSFTICLNPYNRK